MFNFAHHKCSLWQIQGRNTVLPNECITLLATCPVCDKTKHTEFPSALLPSPTTVHGTPFLSKFGWFHHHTPASDSLGGQCLSPRLIALPYPRLERQTLVFSSDPGICLMLWANWWKSQSHLLFQRHNLSWFSSDESHCLVTSTPEQNQLGTDSRLDADLLGSVSPGFVHHGENGCVSFGDCRWGKRRGYHNRQRWAWLWHRTGSDQKWWLSLRGWWWRTACTCTKKQVKIHQAVSRREKQLKHTQLQRHPPRKQSNWTSWFQ